MKKIFSTILATCALLAATAQTDAMAKLDYNQLLRSSNQQIINDALQKAVVDVARSFYVQDNSTGQLYAREGRDDFGEELSLGVRVEGGILLSRRATEPWLYNTDYNEVKSNYSGYPASIEIRSATDTVRYDSAFCIESLRADSAYSLLRVDAEGLRLGNNSGEVDGWVVLFTTDAEGHRNTMSYRQKVLLDATKDSVEIERSMGITGTLQCGLFVEAVNSRIGTVEFRLCGMVTDANGHLYVNRINIPQPSVNADEPQNSEPVVYRSPNGRRMVPVEKVEVIHPKKRKK